MRPTRLTIDLDAIVNNAQRSRAAVGEAKLCGVVKADAYGHGAVMVARALFAGGCEMLAVALVEEAQTLRRNGIAGPILVLGGDYRGAYADVVGLALTPVVGQASEIVGLGEAAVHAGKTLDIHLEIDSGMSRLGVAPAEAVALARLIGATQGVRLTGLMTHFSHADVIGAPSSARQIAALQHAWDAVAAVAPHLRLRHIVSSGALVSAPQAAHHMVRCGLSLYGIQPVPTQPIQGLRPAMAWLTQPVATRHIAAGQTVSYGGRWTAPRDSHIATLPVGYADGYPRLLSNRGHVLVRGQPAKIVGTVCMDLCMVDITDIDGASWQDEVVLMGQQQQNSIGAHDLAAWADTISYEIIARIGPRVPRVYQGQHAS